MTQDRALTAITGKIVRITEAKVTLVQFTLRGHADWTGIGEAALVATGSAVVHVHAQITFIKIAITVFIISITRDHLG